MQHYNDLGYQLNKTYRHGAEARRIRSELANQENKIRNIEKQMQDLEKRLQEAQFKKFRAHDIINHYMKNIR